MTAKTRSAAAIIIGLALAAFLCTRQPLAGEDKSQRRLRLDPPNISTDKTVKYDYDIVYVRLPRKGFRGDKSNKFESPIWAQAGVPLQMHGGADLMLLRPDGSEEVLVSGGKGSVTDPFAS